MDTKRIYKEKSKYKKKRKGFKGVPAWANKTKTDDDMIELLTICLQKKAHLMKV